MANPVLKTVTLARVSGTIAEVAQESGSFTVGFPKH
jgi:hypothetical protein